MAIEDKKSQSTLFANAYAAYENGGREQSSYSLEESPELDFSAFDDEPEVEDSLMNEERDEHRESDSDLVAFENTEEEDVEFIEVEQVEKLELFNFNYGLLKRKTATVRKPSLARQTPDPIKTGKLDFISAHRDEYIFEQY